MGRGVSGLRIALAAYDTLDDAAADWAEYLTSAEPGSVIDGAIIERTHTEVTRFHAGTSCGWGRGVIACAVCGVLWPPALLVGALAGSVGGEVMTAVRCGLTADAVRDLSAVLERGSFVAMSVLDGRFDVPEGVGRRATSRTCALLAATQGELVGALRSDDGRDA